ncbi:MAG: Gfo/Idh/MocA family oxidoreductase [Candidatus Heimdallarchaeota archaeon]|nr:Gfo/Idh/MocA family oxidoreductase [Candidatus Heimdallarchaeota archaeon]
MFEDKGYDYPLDQVRWTETRNMEEILRLLAVKKLDVKSLITHEFSIDQAQEAYEFIINNPNQTLGVLFNYKHSKKSDLSGERKMFNKNKTEPLKDKIKTAIIGCGNFASKYHLPNIQKIDKYQLLGVVTATGLKAKEIAQKNAINFYATDPKEVLTDSDIDLVVIATRHNLHAAQTEEALRAGKHVFVEKPMALNLEELSQLVEVIKKRDRKFTIGFNRRFSPLIKEAKEILKSKKTPVIINYRIANTFAPGKAGSMILRLVEAR